MACMDTLPVIFFSIDMIVVSNRFKSGLFIAGALLVILAGLLKVLWKFILACRHKDINFLNKQMRYLMPVGFLLILLGLIVDRRKWSISSVVLHLTSFPAIPFLIIGIAGIVAMIYCVRHLDGHAAKSNWIEQTINMITQFSIMLCIIL